MALCKLAGDSETMRGDILRCLRMGTAQAVMTIPNGRQIVAVHQSDGNGHRYVRTEQEDTNPFVNE